MPKNFVEQFTQKKSISGQNLKNVPEMISEGILKEIPRSFAESIRKQNNEVIHEESYEESVK